jgi:hypothetical protein
MYSESYKGLVHNGVNIRQLNMVCHVRPTVLLPSQYDQLFLSSVNWDMSQIFVNYSVCSYLPQLRPSSVETSQYYFEVHVR